MAGKLPFTKGLFTLDREQVEKAVAWLAEHAKTCTMLGADKKHWLGSPLSYTFRPHGIGMEVHAICNCGEKVDLTDHDSIP